MALYYGPPLRHAMLSYRPILAADLIMWGQFNILFVVPLAAYQPVVKVCSVSGHDFSRAVEIAKKIRL
jgi:hypothetical protein